MHPEISYIFEYAFFRSDRNEFNQMRLWGLFQFGRDSASYYRTEFSVDRQLGEKRECTSSVLEFWSTGRLDFVLSSFTWCCENFLVVIPTRQHIIKLLLVLEQHYAITKGSLSTQTFFLTLNSISPSSPNGSR